MRNTPVVLLLLAVSGYAFAQKVAAPNAVIPNAVTIDEFGRYLATIQRLRDKQAAAQIAGVTLKERAGPGDVARWQAGFKGGKARQALTAVGDISEFLGPPPSIIPNALAPTVAAQVEILKQAVNYVEQTMPRLPNFLAVRTTTRFDIATRKQLEQQEQMSELYTLNIRKPRYEALGAMNGKVLFFGGALQFVVTYRDGAEVSQSQIGNNRHPPPLGLETTGEFGPILTTVLGDALKGSIVWSRWELGAYGQLAVFEYSVPKSASHYMVADAMGGSAELPAYRGKLAIDPVTGAIYRITLTSEGSKSSVALESNISVEYGPVEIGGKTYVCPLHGVAYTMPRMVDAKGVTRPGQQQESDSPQDGPHYLNDATFTQYHLFRSEVKILSSDPQP